MIIAIDPGLTRTGIVCMSDDGNVLRYATFAADDAHDERQLRAWDLANALCDWCLATSSPLKDTLVIERPIVGKNIENFEKQMRLFTSIINAFWFRVGKVVEVTPTRMKKTITGNGAAIKIDIINASPFDGPGEWVGEGMFTKKQREAEDAANHEAVADAWGIGMCYIKGSCDSLYITRPIHFSARGPIIEGP